ncbi:MAG: C-GCAxxG-C-C family (seleno)protein [Desulfovibrionaceae bacterium]
MQDELGTRATALFESGFHCAEAVAAAVMERFGNGNAAGDAVEAGRLAAAAFGGGIGKSHEGICGCMAGGLVALGLLQGRRAPGLDWQPLADLAVAFRDAFASAEGSQLCGPLLAAYGPQDNMDKCKLMAGRAAALLARMIGDAGGAPGTVRRD